ncbi:MAG: ribonuclease R [Gammaproteobacteria bacterium]|nr:ribonuclease R [Gammaproteobacteria bacterium]
MRKQDPHAGREAARYEHPIPSREFILSYLKERQKMLTFKQLAKGLGLADEAEREGLRRRLIAMEKAGQLLRDRRDRLGPVTDIGLLPGRVIGHADGFGFARPDDGSEDLFLSPREMHRVFHGDRVVVQVRKVDQRGRREGGIVEVLERAHQQLVGRVHRDGNICYLVADDRRISQDVLLPDADPEVCAKQIAVVRLLRQPDQRQPPLGEIVEILGEHLAPGMETEIAVRKFELPVEWPAATLSEAARWGTEVAANAKQGRTDLRDLPLVTIDGEDARDFDDAVYCERNGDGWRLFVAIADVSHYVEPGTALDEEARNRGTSVYFPQLVIPMLPEALSNGLCSLMPEVDRLCMVCEMQIDPGGEPGEYQFYPAVMRSQARLTYSQVAALFDGRKEGVPGHLEPHLFELRALYQAMVSAKTSRGAIDFDSTESRIEFDDSGKIANICAVVRNDAHRLIEECMIAANRCAARFLSAAELPALYRVHDRPAEERVTDLRAFLAELGLELRGGSEPAPGDLAQVLEQARERPDRHLIQTVALRSLKQAVYVPENNGHFGLSLDAYAHFTSPIRRYPDLLVHRGIRHVLSGKKPNRFIYQPADMVALGEHCSHTERRAEEASRDTVAWLKCEFMMERVGQPFAGVISGVTGFGLFVELNELYIEGLVHVTALGNDYYEFDAVHHRLIGRRSRKQYRVGDAIKVQVVRVDLDERKIDLVLAG